VLSGLQPAMHTTSLGKSAMNASVFVLHQLGALRKGVEFIQAALASVRELCH